MKTTNAYPNPLNLAKLSNRMQKGPLNYASLVLRAIVVAILVAFSLGPHRSLALDLDEYFSDPKGSMDYFNQNLYKLQKKREKRLVRIVFYGTSSNGYDRVSSQIRRSLQPKFGDGGKGFVVLSRGWKHLRHQDIVWSYKKFKTALVTKKQAKDKLYGLGGISASNKGSPAYAIYETVNPVESGKFVPGTRFSNFHLFYLAQKNGGNILVDIDGKITKVIKTANAQKRSRMFSLRVNDGPHKVTIKTTKKPTRLFGAIFERDSGLVIDSQMLVGGRARHLLNWNSAHIKKQIGFRNPDLIMFQLGANEACGNPDEGELDDFVEKYTRAVKLFRSGKPEASCLLLSIKDIASKKSKKTIKGVPKIVSAIQKVAANTNCAFFNLYEAIGGKGTMVKWREDYDNPLVSKDYGHLLNRGAKKIGLYLSKMLYGQYQQWRLKKADGTHSTYVH